MDDSTLITYNAQPLGLYTPKWRLRKTIYVEQHRPAGVKMCEALLACIIHVKDSYSNPLLLDSVHMCQCVEMYISVGFIRLCFNNCT